MPWLVSIICLLGLVVLFFPFVFRIEFLAKYGHIEARFFFFKKCLYIGKKVWNITKGENLDQPNDLDLKNKSNEDVDTMPEFVPSKPIKKVHSENNVQKTTPIPLTKEHDSIKPSQVNPNLTVAQVQTASATSMDSKHSEEPSKPEEKKKPEKRHLTDKEFWTILLTPDLDSKAFFSFKKILEGTFCLFRIRFEDCFIEGIRMRYDHMGYGAAFNGFIKSYPWLCDWDIRMDWTMNHELKTAGEMIGKINLCRVLGYVLLILFHGSVLGLSFWHRRRYVLKTNELPELGWLRNKIVGWMVE